MVLVLAVVAAVALPFFLAEGYFNGRIQLQSPISAVFFGGAGLAILMSGWAFVPLLRSNRWLGLVLVLLWLGLGARLRLWGHEETPGMLMAAWGSASLVALLSYLVESPPGFTLSQWAAVPSLALACGLMALVEVPAFRDPRPAIQAQALAAANAAEKVCQDRFGAPLGVPFEGRSLADGTGLMDADTLQFLLVRKRLRHVDLRANAYVERRHLRLESARRPSDLVMVPDNAAGPWLRVALGRSGEPGCHMEASSLLLPRDWPGLPDTCVTLVPIAHADAELQLEWLQPALPDGFRQLELRSATSGLLLALPTGAQVDPANMTEQRDWGPEVCGSRPYLATLAMVQGPEYQLADGSRVLNQQEILVTPLGAVPGKSMPESRWVDVRVTRSLLGMEAWSSWNAKHHPSEQAAQWELARQQGVARCGSACLLQMQGSRLLEYKLDAAHARDATPATLLWADVQGVWQTEKSLRADDAPNQIALHDFEGRLLKIVQFRSPREFQGQAPWPIEWVHADHDTLILTLKVAYQLGTRQYDVLLLQVPLDHINPASPAAAAERPASVP